jgi:hypothetical protein
MVCGDIIVESGLLNTDFLKSDGKKQKLNSDNSLPKNDNSRMNQVEIQNDNLGPTIDQTEDMHMEKAKEISVQEATFNNYVTTHHEKRLDDLLFMNGLSFLGSELSLLSFCFLLSLFLFLFFDFDVAGFL